jgi:nitrogen fixation NifU-like protein
MSEHLRELYQEIIMDHSRSPRGFGKPVQFDFSKESFNPLCGDRVTIYLSRTPQGNLVLAFEGSGCAMCMASTSLLIERLQGLQPSVASTTLSTLFQLLRLEPMDPSDLDSLGKLTILQSVKQYPARVKCVTLPWHALKDLLEPLLGSPL